MIIETCRYSNERRPTSGDKVNRMAQTTQNTVKRLQIPIPALAMRGLVLFPSMMLHFDVGREKSILALQTALERDRRIFLVAQRDVAVDDPSVTDLYSVGVVAEIKQMMRSSEDVVRVLVEGLYKAKVNDLLSFEPYLELSVSRLPAAIKRKLPAGETEALMRAVKQGFEAYAAVAPKLADEVMLGILGTDDPRLLFDLIVQNLGFKFEDKQKLLEQRELNAQLSMLVQILASEAEILNLERDIFEQVKEQMDKNQRDYFLREQMKVISEQLGESENVQDEAMAFSDEINAIRCISEDAREKLLRECDRLYKMPPGSHEGNVVRNYLETVIELPWDEETKDKLDLKRARRILDRDHFGMGKVKDRILESLAVRKLAPGLKGQILCLVGPPGVGKTSIAKAIAEAMGRKYTRISLGGVRDESDIRGHRKTYIGAMPGRIITALRQAKVKNPLILLDEIDKMGADFRGDPSSAMLEVLDSEQNTAFTDHYIEVPFDLSEILFITTANTLETIPAPLLDRMEVVELPSYTREEKFQIAKKHLFPKQLQKHGLSKTQLRVKDDAIYGLIDFYTRESGVRKLERAVAGLCRKAAKQIASAEATRVVVSSACLEGLLGPKKYLPETIAASDEVGVVNGLAWTSVGGETMQIEVSVMEGTGKLELTGNLGNVMKESAHAALSYVRSVAREYGISPSFYQNKDIHIHVPEGAVPKDGPSAGIALTTALVSALADAPVKRDVAMTGEVTLRGRVLAIGGLREKTMAAYRAGVKKVYIPHENKADLAELDPVVLDGIEFVPVSYVSEVLHDAIVFPQQTAKEEGSPLQPEQAAPAVAEPSQSVVTESIPS